jgi:hypothetical protein
MHRNARRRIWKLERLLSKAENLLNAALTKQGESELPLERMFELSRVDARVHATAVAAIALWGKPKIDEPLSCAWKRTLAYHSLDTEPALNKMPGRSIFCGLLIDGNGVLLTGAEIDGHNAEVYADNVERHELGATRILYPLIVDDPDYRSSWGWWNPHIVHAPESANFTEVFRTAPIWLLQFTKIRLDALILEFQLPDLPTEPMWGIEGLKDAKRWPLLPLGTIGAGGAPPKDLLSPEDRGFYEEHQKRPKEDWSRSERRRMQQLVSRLSVNDSSGTANGGSEQDRGR